MKSELVAVGLMVPLRFSVHYILLLTSSDFDKGSSFKLNRKEREEHDDTDIIETFCND